MSNLHSSTSFSDFGNVIVGPYTYKEREKIKDFCCSLRRGYGFTYVLKTADGGVKIGKTIQPAQRFNTIEKSSGRKILLFALTIPHFDFGKSEQSLLRVMGSYGHDRLGEWVTASFDEAVSVLRGMNFVIETNDEYDDRLSHEKVFATRLVENMSGFFNPIHLYLGTPAAPRPDMQKRVNFYIEGMKMFDNPIYWDTSIPPELQKKVDWVNDFESSEGEFDLDVVTSVIVGYGRKHRISLIDKMIDAGWITGNKKNGYTAMPDMVANNYLKTIITRNKPSVVVTPKGLVRLHHILRADDMLAHCVEVNTQ